MEVQIKTAIKAGNSSAVVLPRAWLGKEVRIEQIKKSPEIILIDVIGILGKCIELSEIIGIYLVGSYARKEERKDSDIDILVITQNIDKKLINEGMYNILIISEELLKYKLIQDLLPIGPMLKEAKPLLNSSYLSQIKIKATKKNITWYLTTTKDKLKLIKTALEQLKNIDKHYVPDVLAYTLILRVRTLYAIDRLINNENYSKQEFTNLIKKISGGLKGYQGYLNVKNNLEDNNVMSISEAERLSRYLEKQLGALKKAL